MSIFDFFTTNPLDAIKNQIQNAQYDLENKFGQFLSSGKVINDLKTRADAQRNSKDSDVRSRATALSAKASALLNNFSSIQSDGQDVLSRLSDMKTTIQTDPVLNAPASIQTATRVATLLAKKRQDISNLVSDSASVAARIGDHLKQTDQLSKDVNDLENAAQGKGFGSFVKGVESGVGGNIVKPLSYIIGAGVVLYFLGPALLGKSVRAATRRD